MNSSVLNMDYIDGKKIANRMLAALAVRVAALPYQPVFCDICVGTDSVAMQYVRMKERRAREVGIAVKQASFTTSVTTQELVDAIKELAAVSAMRGLIVQLPLPAHINEQAVLDAIDPAIDVDVLGTENTEKFYADNPRYIYPTAKAVLHLLDHVGIDGKRIVLIGDGKLVGRPVFHLLRTRGADVVQLTKASGLPPDVLKSADILISAAGSPNLITGENIKPGAVLIDAGTAEVGTSVSGDIDTASVAHTAAAIAAVPGGVGPITVASLLENVVISAEQTLLHQR